VYYEISGGCAWRASLKGKRGFFPRHWNTSRRMLSTNRHDTDQNEVEQQAIPQNRSPIRFLAEALILKWVYPDGSIHGGSAYLNDVQNAFSLQLRACPYPQCHQGCAGLTILKYFLAQAAHCPNSCSIRSSSPHLYACHCMTFFNKLGPSNAGDVGVVHGCPLFSDHPHCSQPLLARPVAHGTFRRYV